PPPPHPSPFPYTTLFRSTFNFADNGAGGLASVQALNLDIQAGAGKDQVDALFGPVTGGGNTNGVTLTGNMGYGDDHFNAVQSLRSEEHTSELQSLTNLVC